MTTTDASDPAVARNEGTGTEQCSITPLPSSGNLPLLPDAGDDTDLSYSFLLPAAEPDELGRIGNYRVLKLLGRGGMGFVFVAEDIALRRQCALKVMTPRQAGRTDGWPRFLREARLLASVKHENVVTVYQAGQEKDVAFIAMELLAGETLAAWQSQQSKGRPDEAARVGRGIAAGLAAVHKLGLVHRDIKPANVWLEAPHGTVKLLDFGLARGVEDRSMTHHGTVLGTPAFMSPEQARGDAVDPRSDLFSLGSVLYGLATGTPPFPGNNTLATLTALAVCRIKPARAVNPAVSQGLSDLIDRLLEKDADDRPATAEEVIEAFDRLAAGDEPVAVARPVSVKRRKKKKRPAEPSNRKRWLVLASVLIGTALLGGGVLAVIAARKPATTAAATPPGPTATPKVTYLADLTPFEEEGWLRRPPPPPGGGPADRPPPPPFGLRLGGRVLAHGLFMHPEPRPGPGLAKGSFKLDKKYTTFRAGVGLNDDNGGRTERPLQFLVYGDGKKLWSSKPVQIPGDHDECTLDVTGVSVLTLEVRNPGSPHAAHAVWADPRLEN
jgi:hypothetical protein